MKKLYLLFLLLMSLLTYQSYLGQSFTLATCSTGLSTNTYGPMNSVTTADSKNRTAFIIPASQLLAIADGTITSTYFRRIATSGSLPAGTTFKIYLKNTAALDFGSGSPDWATEISTATLVYNSDPAVAVGSTAGYKQFAHTAGFVYTGGSNLAVYVEYVQTTPPTTAITWDYEYGSPCVTPTTGTNTTKYVLTTGAFGPTLTSSNGRRPVVGFDVTMPPATAAPACTTVSAPANAATNVSLTPTITWSGVYGTNGASSYLINLGTTPGGTDVLNAYNAGNTTSYAIPSGTLSYNTNYYLKVIPTNNIGPATGCNETSFTTLPLPCPSVSQPANNATGTSLKPTIIWSSVGGATGYRLSVGTTSGGTDILNNIDVGNVLNYTFTSNLNPSTQYFYTVTAYQGGSVSSGCTVRNFTTGTAVAPANDDCANAVALTVNPTLTCTTTTPGNTLGATLSMAATPCSGTPNDDVWYSFVATSTSHLVSLTDVVSTGVSSVTDMYFQVLSGACGALTSILCSDDDVNIVTGLTPGVTYYVRVYTYSSAANASASFNICISTQPAPPANDNCVDAVTLTVNPDMNCGTVTAGTTSGATSSGVALGTCSGTADDDVWYKFTATATSHSIQLKNVVSVGTSSSTSLYVQVFSGACGTLTSTSCITSNTNYTLLSGLTIGGTYYVRVYNSNSNAGATLYANTFDVCVGTLPPPPANNECANAVSLAVSSSNTFTSLVNGSTLSATQSTATAPTCSATGINDDVWYSFTATSATHLVHVLYSDNATTTQVYSGTCGSLTAVTCFAGGLGNSNVLLQNLNVGETYYVRVFSTSSTAATASNFQIAVTTPSAVSNDTCATAAAIACNGSVQGSNALATDDTLPTSTCGGTGTTATYKGVWYTVTATENGPITIDACGTQYDAYLRVYTGDCTTLTCFANTSGTGYADAGCTSNIYNAPKLTFTGVTGTTYYVLLTGYAATRIGNYSISVTQGCSSLGTNEIKDKEDRINAYPNPFADVLNISDVSNVKSVSVMDVAGRLVKTIDTPSSSLHLGELKSGLYLVVLNMKDGSRQAIKAIKK